MYLQYYGGQPFTHGITYENSTQDLDDRCDFENIFILLISWELNKNDQMKKFSTLAMKFVQKSNMNLLL